MSDAFFADGLGAVDCDMEWGSALQNVVGTAPYAGEGAEGGTAREEFRQRFLDSPVVLETASRSAAKVMPHSPSSISKIIEIACRPPSTVAK